ncbi:aspartate carbamoyltransferase [Thermoproteus tenax]|uniref:Aspartate carbamoyltransferase n=1 Tax=Thermoproteus tenax (strain ATCC 35583 / DSM 2078 / JCM 9277 / NBRC 100435 / Kra 1) TaxID=768679 RepID=G4RPG0_THETK|nr:aspartate carbamoyltransferase [Thermoproteus tenax]CCC81455.1 Aspartate carbamoyltransferase catalytic chain [Thermoproteus tenax Kra 1]
MSWRGRDVVSIRDFTRRDLEELFDKTRQMEAHARGRLDLLKGKILAVAFFEPSTRTRLSFETAMKRLGGDVIGFSSAEGTSVEKGETLADTIRMLDSYADAIVIRHRAEGAAKFAAEVAEAPVINAGDGAFNHPTQAMLDLYTIWRIKGRVDGLRVGIMGDLKYARTVNSLLEGLALFDVDVYLISPEFLRPRQETLDYIESRGLKYKLLAKVEEILPDLDVLYVVRIQKERFLDPLEYERVKGSYKVTAHMLKGAKEDLIVLHPLPRVDELDPSVDKTRHAAYFKQAAYGVPLRMALLSLILS